MKYKQSTPREAISLLLGILLSAILVGIYANGKIHDLQWREAKTRITLGKLVSAIEEVEDNNEPDLADLKELARDIGDSILNSKPK